MKDIILPSETSDAIDLGAIDNEITGIVIPYKGDNAVGYIAYTCGEAIPWALFNTIDNIKTKNSISTLTAVQTQTKITTDGTYYYSSLAGNPSEPYKTADVNNIWNNTIKKKDIQNQLGKRYQLDFCMSY